MFEKAAEDYWNVGCVSRRTCFSHHSFCEYFCPPAPLPPPHLSLHLPCASPIFSLPLFSSSSLLSYCVIRSSIGVLVPARSSLLTATATSVSFKTTYSLPPRLSWCSSKKTFWGTSCSDPAALWQICWTDWHGAQQLQPALRVALSWAIFSAKLKKKKTPHYLTVTF